MKRKKWSELEEQTLLSKYSDLLHSGTLAKLKTREKKFKPIADHVNAIHHLNDPINYPFRWSWRDVSIKVQNMRHQYLGVKQKIRVPDGGFNWDDGVNHWENFLRYRDVFGDVELEVREKRVDGEFNWDDDGLGLGFESEDFEEDGDVEEEENEGFEEGFEDGEGNEEGNLGYHGLKKRRIALLGARVLELRDVLVKREERAREREFSRDEEGLIDMENMKERCLRDLEERLDKREFTREDGRIDVENMREERLGKREFSREEGRIDVESMKERRLRDAEERLDNRELELEEMHMRWARVEFDRRLRFERELDEERRLKMRLEEKREAEEMEWRERMLGMQMHHEKQMMQMHADACQNQMHILGVMARLMCQYFGSGSDGLGGLTPQVLENMQHPGTQDLGHDNKPDSNSTPEYM